VRSLLFCNYHDLIEVGIATAIEHMLVDALLSADLHLKFAKKVFEPEQYLHLTDAIMPRIEATTDPVINSSLRSSCMSYSYCLPGTCRSSCHI
jgi:hypothetical protein